MNILKDKFLHDSEIKSSETLIYYDMPLLYVVSTKTENFIFLNAVNSDDTLIEICVKISEEDLGELKGRSFNALRSIFTKAEVGWILFNRVAVKVTAFPEALLPKYGEPATR